MPLTASNEEIGVPNSKRVRSSTQDTNSTKGTLSSSHTSIPSTVPAVVDKDIRSVTDRTKAIVPTPSLPTLPVAISTTTPPSHVEPEKVANKSSTSNAVTVKDGKTKDQLIAERRKKMMEDQHAAKAKKSMKPNSENVVVATKHINDAMDFESEEDLLDLLE